ncbi:DUF4132 domain-containing protein [Nocardia huaxiensis]|uniref:DUF4132 domain-containing protein n=1 Tax=Nocardia huaxiensis TaxID=2755382 RepID=UPI001E334604|nr:DUF4132 domain-containing protein [Nocardia huaxiensis]UFS99718.1 DUF4132 domain-containing protein [Nocardia huaxiensis]
MRGDEDAWRVPDSWWGQVVPAWGFGPRAGAEFAVHECRLLLGADPDQLRDRLIHAVRLPDLLYELRRGTAALSEEEYRTLVAGLAAAREGTPPWQVRIAASVLAPGEQRWVDEDLAHDEPEFRDDGICERHLLGASITTVAQLRILVERFAFPSVGVQNGFALLYSALVRVGPEGGFVLGRLLEQSKQPDEMREHAHALAWLPTDEAFAQLLKHADRTAVTSAITAAVQRFPRRAMRMLNEAGGSSLIIRHLRFRHARANPELAAEFGCAPVNHRVAPVREVPAALRRTVIAPPGRRVRRVVLTGFHEPQPVSLAWLEGEREEWAAARFRRPQWANGDVRAAVDRELAGPHPNATRLAVLLACADGDIALEHLGTPPPALDYSRRDLASNDTVSVLTCILGRFDTDAVEFVLPVLRKNPAELGRALGALTGTEITRLMAGGLRRKAEREGALEWFDRHIGTAAADLIADALSDSAGERSRATAALRTLSADHRARIRSTALAFGPEVGAAITAIIGPEPPAPRASGLPEWFDPATLPPVFLRETRRALPDSAIIELGSLLASYERTARPLEVAMLLEAGESAEPIETVRPPAHSAQNNEPAGIPGIKSLVDSASLAEFAWALFEEWRLAEFPWQDDWVLTAVGLLGDDETADRIALYLHMWSSNSLDSFAVSWLDALVAIGTRGALRHLHRLSERAGMWACRDAARLRLEQVAARAQLTLEDLLDSLAPTFGFDAGGRLELDYGPRGFLVQLDDQLNLHTFDAVRPGHGPWSPGARRRAVPKPAADDSPTAGVAHRRYRTARKGMKRAVREQARRLESAMVRGRRWPVAAHRQTFGTHPLLARLARRVVWATYDDAGIPFRTFRIAEDGSYADVSDRAVSLPEPVRVGVAHPLDLGGAVPAWTEVFTDYEILQPFEQLARAVFPPASPEAADGVERFRDLTVSTGSLLRLCTRGWETQPDGGDAFGELFRPLDHGNQYARIVCEPGIPRRDPLSRPQQRIWVSMVGHFARLSPIEASELLRDLESLRVLTQP